MLIVNQNTPEECYHNKVIISGYDGLSSWLYLGMIDSNIDQLLLSSSEAI